jgi:hypothetical protein
MRVLSPSPRERGSALVVTLLALVALLGIGGVTLLAVQSEAQSAGQDRFNNTALYAAESGVSAATEFLRENCDPTRLFSAWVEPSNLNAQHPEAILDNGKRPEQDNIFRQLDPKSQAWYDVSILNELTDPGYAAGDDTNGIVVVHAVGYGPNNTRTAVEMELRNDECLASACAAEYAQKGNSSLNSSNPACSQQVTAVGAAGARRVSLR